MRPIRRVPLVYRRAGSARERSENALVLVLEWGCARSAQARITVYYK